MILLLFRSMLAAGYSNDNLLLGIESQDPKRYHSFKLVVFLHGHASLHVSAPHILVLEVSPTLF